MRNRPRSSVIVVRTFSIRTGLEASTVTPGSVAPDASLAEPVMDACAKAATGTKMATATRSTPRTKVRIGTASSGVFVRGTGDRARQVGGSLYQIAIDRMPIWTDPSEVVETL